jgi:hypothetical protein
MHTGLATLRGNTDNGFATMRDEMRGVDASLRDNIEKLRHEIVRQSLSDRIWMFSFAAGLVTVMAHGFKWI